MIIDDNAKLTENIYIKYIIAAICGRAVRKKNDEWQFNKLQMYGVLILFLLFFFFIFL